MEILDNIFGTKRMLYLMLVVLETHCLYILSECLHSFAAGDSCQSVYAVWFIAVIMFSCGRLAQGSVEVDFNLKETLPS